MMPIDRKVSSEHDLGRISAPNTPETAINTDTDGVK